MDKVALLSLEERKGLFSETAAQKNILNSGMSAAVIMTASVHTKQRTLLQYRYGFMLGLNHAFSLR